MPLVHSYLPTRLRSGIVGLITLLAVLIPPAPAVAQDAIPTIEDRTAGMNRMDGFFNIFWDAGTGSLFWEISALDTEFLYQISMGSGLAATQSESTGDS